VLQQAHLGPGIERQRGLQEATGSFIAFADADDEVVSSVLDSAARLLHTTGGDVAITAFQLAPMQGATKIPRTGLAREVPSRRVLTSRAAIWGKVYRREFLVGNSISFPPVRSADDVIFSWRVASRNPVTYEMSEVGYRYWIDPHGQLTRDPRYFVEGTDSLVALWKESLRSHHHGRILGAYACVTGLGHILRKSAPRVWPQVVARAARAASSVGPLS
jgi:hypothetical protein